MGCISFKNFYTMFNETNLVLTVQFMFISYHIVIINFKFVKYIKGKNPLIFLNNKLYYVIIYLYILY